MADYTAQIESIYLAYYGRPADVTGLAYWNTALNTANGDLASIINSFGTSAEATSLYSSSSNVAKINAIYLALFNRSADAEGLIYYAGLLDNGTKSQASIALDILNGATGDDLTLITKKLAVSADFTAAMQSDATAMIAYAGTTAATTARAMLSAVTADSDDSGVVETTLTTIETATTDTTTAAAQTFTLTTSADVSTAFTGDSGDDGFYGVIGTDGLSANGTTFNPGDNLKGSTGADTLSISISGTNTADQTTSSFTLAGVETLSFANFQTANGFDTIIDLANVTDLDAVVVTSSSASGDTELTTVQNLISASMSNGASDLSITYIAAAVAGTTTLGTGEAQSLTLSAQTAGTFTVDSVETFNVVSNTSTNTMTLAGDALDTVNVSGSAALDLGTLAATVTTVDATSMTGALTLTADTGVDYSIVGGTGNDVITVDADFDTADTIDGGDGTDTLSIVTDIAAAAELTTSTSNFEILELGALTDVTLAVAISGLTEFDLTDTSTNILTLSSGYTGDTTVVLTGDATANADQIINDADIALTVTANDADIDATTVITGGTGTDAINLKATGGTATLTLTTGLETITVVAGTVATSDIVIAMGANDTQIESGTTLTVTAAALTSSGATLTFTGNDAETDGYLNVTGGAGADTITGGASGLDSLSGGANNDSLILTTIAATNIIDGGAGSADTLTVTTDIASVAVLAGVTNVETLILGVATDLTLASTLSATGITSINAADTGDNIITLSSGYTGATTVVLTGDDTNSDQIINSANVALTVTANDADIDATTVITGGTGTDAINLKATGGTATLTLTTKLETITVVAGTLGTEDLTIAMGANNTQIASGKTLTVTAAALTSSGATLTFTGNTAETDGYLNVTGGAGADTITGGASGLDSLSGGANNDSLILTTLASTNIIDGGAGTVDTLTVTTDITSASQFAGVTNVETLILGTATDLTLASTLAATGITKINAANTGNNIITLSSGYTGATTVVLTGDNANADQIINSANVALTITANDADIDAATVITGGTGTDAINLKASGGTATLTLTTGLETITVVAGTVATSDIVITMGTNNTQIASGKTLTVNAAALTNSGATLTFNGTTSETNGYLSIVGGAGADVITGGGNSDTITGGSGLDTINFAAATSKYYYDTFTDAATGDILDGTDLGTEVWASTDAAGSQISLASQATFSDYLDAAVVLGGDTDTDAAFAWFQYGSNTYVVQAMADHTATTTFIAGTDAVICLSGLLDLTGSTVGDGIVTIAIA